MELVFIDKHEAGGGAVTFRFRSRKPLEWVAGQSVRLELPGVYGPEERRFTISSSPREEFLAITTRPSNSFFKQALWNLKPGKHIKAFDIRGDFIWTTDTKPLVLLASGVGVTPFRAILADRLRAGLSIPSILLHAFSGDEGVFSHELTEWTAKHPEFLFVPLQGQRLNYGHLLSHAAAFGDSLFYISGPSAMVDDLSAALIIHGVGERQIKKDWFTGRLGRDD